MPKRFVLYLVKLSKSFALIVPIEVRCVSLLLKDVVTNVASTTLIDKLEAPTKMHPIPYTLQWLN